MTTSPARDVDLDEMRGDSLLGDERERREERDVLDEAELRGGRNLRVDLEQLAMGDEDEHGENRADDEERGPETDQARGRPGATNDPIAAVPIARPQVTPSTRVSTVVGNRALEEREPGDVDDAVRRADHGEQDDHRHGDARAARSA